MTPGLACDTIRKLRPGSELSSEQQRLPEGMASHFIVGHRAGRLLGDSNNRAGDVGWAVAGRACERRATMVHNRIACVQRAGCVVPDTSIGPAVYTQPERRATIIHRKGFRE